jgi:hypothetical protein
VTLVHAARFAFAAFLAFVTWQTLKPDPDDLEAGFDLARFIAAALFGSDAHADKVAHFMAYAGLGSVGGLARLAPAGALVAALALYGGALEILQGLGAVRVADWADAGANALGAMCGLAVVAVVARVIAKKGQQ